MDKEEEKTPDGTEEELPMNFVGLECWVPFVRLYAYLDTSDAFVELATPEAHVIDVMTSPDDDYAVKFCWMFSRNEDAFLAHMALVLLTADDGYMKTCHEIFDSFK